MKLSSDRFRLTWLWESTWDLLEGEDLAGRPFSTLSISVSLVSICNETEVLVSVSALGQVDCTVSSYLQDSNLYLVVVCAEVLEVTEAHVRQADHDGDDEHHEGKHGRRGQKPWETRGSEPHLDGTLFLPYSPVVSYFKVGYLWPWTTKPVIRVMNRSE